MQATSKEEQQAEGLFLVLTYVRLRASFILGGHTATHRRR
jgi:hypothetical protein